MIPAGFVLPGKEAVHLSTKHLNYTQAGTHTRTCTLNLKDFIGNFTGSALSVFFFLTEAFQRVYIFNFLFS